MKLIKKLDMRKRPNGHSVVRYGLFYCPACNNEVERALGDGLRYKSCGCFAHGGHGTRLHTIWGSIKQRCNNKNSGGFRWYGARGIRVCEGWSKFANFRDWALQNGYNDDLEIDRIDNNGNYEPDNCQFISGKDNLRKRSSMRLNMLKAHMIRDLEKTGNYTTGDLSSVFGVSNSNIRAVIRNELWSDD